METLEAIRTRRSVGKVKPERPPRELIEKLLRAAVEAPNHHLTQPWRFFVLAGRAREELGEVMAAAQRRQLSDPEGEKGRESLAKEAGKPLRAPVVIAVAASMPREGKAVPIEEVEATAAAVQNLLLAAHDLGLGAMWRTGDTAYEPAVKQFFGLSPDDQIVAFVYVGYPEVMPRPRERKLAGDMVQWMGWDQ